MAAPIEDYALLSNMATGALVSKDGSVDWLCFPRFDSASIYGALLGGEEHGRWRLAPSEPTGRVQSRTYLDSSFVLETIWSTPGGLIKVTDFMPVNRNCSSLLRRVTGLQGVVHVDLKFNLRPQYGVLRPWTSRVPVATSSEGQHALVAMAGPDAWALHGRYLPEAHDHMHVGNFVVGPGENVDFELTWFPSYQDAPSPLDFDAALTAALDYWNAWGGHCRSDGAYGAGVKRSLLVLRALTHYETGGIVAAPTTSLPEEFGGSRNWDYRYCWLRDASLTLEAMLTHGYETEALKWRNWLLRALAGDPEDIQIMYGVGGERELPERVLDHLPGYQNARPVRVGNAAVSQYQADVVGEVMVALERLRLAGGKEDTFSWALQRALLGYVEKHFKDRDCGLWEIRGPTKYFTHSRVMMWAAFDCGVRAVKDHGLPGPAQHWSELRARLRGEIMDKGFNRELNSFTQTYGGRTTDAALLTLPHVGFLAFNDGHMLGTVAQIERQLMTDHGLLMRYLTETGIDGLEPGEHPFLACSFWLVEQYARTDRWAEAKTLMDTLVGFSNELGLLSEEFSPQHQRMAGNFPQAFSHLALVRAADALHGVDRLSLSVERNH